MNFGIAVFSNLDAWKTVMRAEQLGFTHAWFYDSQLLAPDVFIAMALAAEHTSKIKLGTGVLVPTNRIAPVAANAFASLNRLAPGRIIFGVGTGFTARNTMGMGPMALRDLREYLRVARAMMRGETVEWSCEGAPRKIRFLNPELGLINLADPVPIHISAFAPKARRLAAELGDGWMAFMSATEPALQAAGEMAKTCAEVRRDPTSIYKTVFTLGCVLGGDEPFSSPRAKAQAGPLATVFLHALIEASIGVAPTPALQPMLDEYRAQYDRYEPHDARYLQMHRMHLLGVRPEEERFVTPELIAAATFTGRAEELRDRVRALAKAGYDQIAVQLVPGHEAALEDWARLFETA